MSGIIRVGESRYVTDQLRGFTRRVAARAVPVDVRSLVGEAVHFSTSARPGAAAYISVDIPTLPRISGATDSLGQAFENLILNAIDAVERLPEPHVWISATVVREEADAPGSAQEQVEVTIRDSGPGVPSAARAHIFEPFFTTKAPRGLGLGLTIVKQVIEAHGGTVRLGPGPGAELIARLPCALETAQKDMEPGEEPSRQSLK